MAEISDDGSLTNKRTRMPRPKNSLINKCALFIKLNESLFNDDKLIYGKKQARLRVATSFF